MRMWLTIVAALLLGGVAGYWLRGELSAGNALPPPTVARVEEPAPPPPKAVPAQPAPVASESESEPKPAAAPAAPPKSPYASLEALMELRKKGQMSFFVQVLGPDHHLSAAIKKLLNISDAEAAALNSTIDATTKRIGEIEASRAVTQTNPKDNSLVISVPAYPDQGGQLYDQMMGEMQNVLGPERSDLLLQVAGSGFDSSFGGFGVQNRTVTVQHVAGSDGHPGEFTIKDQRVMPVMSDGKPGTGSMTTSQSTLADRDAVSKQLGGLAGLLPPNY